MCPSWPHICAAPLFFDSYSKCEFSSVIDSASMSALKATQQSLPFGSAFPLRSTTSAVGQSGLMASSGTPNSMSMLLTLFWVSNSAIEISGKRWISLLNWITLQTMDGSMWLCWMINRQQIDMSFQFKVRPKENPHEECEKEISLLKGYNQALEKENESRNIERQAMQAEIERLTRLQREWKEKGVLSSSKVINIYESHEYLELKQSYLDVKNKYEKTLLENSTLTTKLISTEVSQSRLVSLQDEKTRLNEVIKSLEAKIFSLESKVVGYERQVTELKTKQSSSLIISRQQHTETAKIDDLQRQVRSKNEEILRLQRQLSTKEQQLSGFKRDIANYAIKIDALSEQLGKLERTQRVEIRYVEKEETLVLRSKLEQINNINGSLSMENNSLRIDRSKQAELIKDLERRIAILQDTNANLQNELRLAIEAKKTASRVVVQEDQSLKEAVYTLKTELEEVRRFNQLVRQENDELYVQLQSLKSGSKCHRCQHRHRSKSPIRQPEEKVIKAKLVEQTATHSHLTHSHTRHSHNCNHASQASIAPKAHHHHTDKSRLEGSLATGERYLDLQRKIQLLQSENQVLKQHLVYEI